MPRKHLSSILNRLKLSAVAMLFVGTQLVFPLGISGLLMGHAAATASCVTDTAGANDVPGQKDLTQLCVDYSGTPTSVSTTWNWDDAGTQGNNSMDACNLFDTDGDGNVNYAVCVSTQGNPATFSTLTTYSCSDKSIDTCTSPNSVVSSGSTNCTVAQSATDPFSADDDYPKDTQGSCTIQLSTVGGSSATLLDVCSYPSGQPTSDPSDCVIAKPSAAKLEVNKVLSPTTDSGLFNLGINTTTYATGVGNGGSTGEQVVSASNNGTSYTVFETANANSPSALSAYTTSVVCKDAHGTGSTLASGNPTDNTTRSITVSVKDATDVVCTFTNTRLTGSITLVKNVINDNGGTATANDFGLTVGGTSVTSGQTLTLNPGSYAINEAGLSGYSFVGISGAGCPTVLGGSVTLTASQNITCTITNDDIAPQLTVIKHVVNDNGGTKTASDFTMNVTGTNVSDASFAGAESPGTTVTLDAGSYSVDEGAHTGYSETLSSDCSGTIAIGESKVCTITNDDIAPQLTLIKDVTNDNGGTAVPSQWTLSATPSNGSSSTLSGAGGFTAQTAQANQSYTLGESGGPSGYSASAWQCDGGSLSGSSLTLSPGDNVSCTITNDDIAPLLTVTKVVTNDSGGTLTVSSFPLNVSGTTVTSGVQQAFSAGTYTVGETQQPGYSLDSITGDCLADGSITMVVGGVYSCTITNNDIPATITVTKVVHNNHGGTAGVNDFYLYVGNTKVTSGVASTFAANQQYTVSEIAQVNGYHQDSIVCTDTDTQTDLTDTFTPTLGEHIACTITNSDIAPQLTVIKHVVNDNGGTKTASDFTMNVTGTNVSDASFAGAESPGTTVTLDAGSYSVDEGAHTGYTETVGQNCNGTIALGETKTCIITNDDIAPTLTVVKDVVNDNGGNNTADSFTVNVNGASLSGGTLSNSNLTDTYTVANPVANTAYTVSEDPSSGYTQTSLTCTDNDTGAPVGNPVTLAPGQNATCVITNDDVAPQLTVVKDVVNDNGGNAKASDFTLRVNGHSLTGGTLTNNGLTDTYTYPTPLANTAYTISEDAMSGYHQDSIVCTDDGTGAPLTNPVSLNEGQNVTCVITNNDVAPTLTVVKNVVNDNGGNNTADSFTVQVNGSALSGGTLTNNDLTDTYTFANPLANTQYAVSEASPTASGYTQSSLLCTDNDTQAAVANPVTLNEGQNVTCVITNDDIAPSLTVVKNVTNDNGGTVTADQFSLRVNGTQLSGGTLSNSDLTDTYTYSSPAANTAYTVTEDPYSGYASSGFTCTDNATHATVANPVTLTEGQNVTCTVTNDDIAPTLTLVKNVTNDNGGTNTADQWTLTAQHASDTPLISATGAPSNNGATATTSAAAAMANTSYNLSESGPSGYTASSWSCSAGGTLTGNSVSLAPGADVTCSITNDDVAPLLTVTKVVVNDDGGTLTVSSFPLNVSGTQVTSGTQNAFTAGSYLIGETQQTGYSLGSITGDCLADGSITMVVGGVYGCTITNNDIAPKLTLVKQVVNDNGGTAKPTDWILSATPDDNQYQTLSGPGGFSDQTARANETYTLSESTGPDGYSASGWSCDGGILTGDTLTLGLADDVTCTITNDDIAPHLTLTKIVNNDNGNNAAPEDWTLSATPSDSQYRTITGQGTADGDAQAGIVYTLSEAGGPVGYTPESWSCLQGDEEAATGQNGDTLTMNVGDVVMCFITNDSDAPVINLTKTNNRPDPTSIGDTVTYTLVVTVPATSGVVYNATVTDLPPKNFVVNNNSWTASSNVPGHDVAADVASTGGPHYGSPGNWFLGTLIPGEVVTLTYQAVIGSSVSAGTYPDLAFVAGFNQMTGGTRILGNLGTGSTTPFVSTAVTVKVQPQVLGASIVLVNTGTNLLAAQFILPIIAFGAVYLTRRLTSQKGGRA